MDEELKQYPDGGFAASSARWDAMEERLVARIKQFEAAILEGFRDLADPSKARASDLVLQGFYDRRALAEQLISELERKRAS
jgi:hypothetical protein